ncbi:Predicted membrane protein [Pedobacter terrae]|uniref:Predicted membrane protein n=1 Tax=Pedobacter terrae TaxID=405671 RepID=A0A1G7PUL3_9SPHI|nr:LiaF domain-containing protein [Pedobacter terrae]SDF89893.1 Predicted membrane protein [Pedobacter terrae]
MENINHHNNNQVKNSGRVWSGFIIIIIGFAFLLNNIGLNIPRWIFSWSNFLILLGVFLGVRRNFKGIGWLVLILVGTYNTLIHIPGLDLDLSKYALGFGLVIVGCFLIFRPKHVSLSKKKDKRKASFDFEGEPDQESVNSNDVIDVMAVFGGSHQTVYTKNFQGGDITAVFGGADIVMTQADFPETVSLDVTAVFGGIKLIVPQNWAIKSNVTALFGSVEDKRSHVMPVAELKKTLILDGTALFGGIEIKSF